MKEIDINRKQFVLLAICEFLAVFLKKTFAKRIVASVLLVMNTPVKSIVAMLDMGQSTVYDLRKLLLNANNVEDIQSLFQMKPGSGRPEKAKSLSDQIESSISSGSFSSLREIRNIIIEKFCIKLSIASVSRLVKSLGIKRLKVASFPANADPEAQKDFYHNTLLPLMRSAQNQELHLLFMDGSHFVMGCDFLGYIYGAVRRFVHSHSGRQRYNVLGALDFVTKMVHTITNTTYLTATEVIQMMEKIAAAYGTAKPIRLVLDNARYQKCKVVVAALQNLQKTHDIDLVYLPPYSPNLNLVERIWRFVKTEIRTTYIQEIDFQSFCNNIDNVIDSTSGKNKDRIDSLIGDAIQLYDSLVPVDAHTFVMPKKKKEQVA